jgi:hypothetical protein
MVGGCGQGSGELMKGLARGGAKAITMMPTVVLHRL